MDGLEGMFLLAFGKQNKQTSLSLNLIELLNRYKVSLAERKLKIFKNRKIT
jgi:hypothetical protein